MKSGASASGRCRVLLQHRPQKRLEDNLPRLETVLFQKELGTLRDKTDRIQALAGWIAAQIGADVNHATRAGCCRSAT